MSDKVSALAENGIAKNKAAVIEVGNFTNDKKKNNN